MWHLQYGNLKKKKKKRQGNHPFPESTLRKVLHHYQFESSTHALLFSWPILDTTKTSPGLTYWYVLVFSKKNAPPLAALFTPSSQSPLWKFIRPGTRINLCRGPKNRRKKHQATQQHSARRVATLRHGSNFVTDQHTGFGVLELQQKWRLLGYKKEKTTTTLFDSVI